MIIESYKYIYIILYRYVCLTHQSQEWVTYCIGIVAEVAVEVNIIRLKEIDVHICGTCTVKMLLLNFFCHGTLSHDYLRRLLETKMDSNN